MRHCPVCCLCEECVGVPPCTCVPNGGQHTPECQVQEWIEETMPPSLVMTKPRPLTMNGSFCAECNRYRSAGDIVLHSAFNMRASATGPEFAGFTFLVDLGRLLKDGSTEADVLARVRAFSDRRKKMRATTGL